MGERPTSEDGIEITPEMIEAGVRVWIDWNESDDPYPENLIRGICSAVLSAGGCGGDQNPQNRETES